MTATSTSQLEGILAARKAELIPPPGQFDPATGQAGPSTAVQSDYIPPADPVTGEIMPAAAVEQAPPPVPVAPAPEPTVHYPEVPPKVVGGLPYIREYVKLARTIQQTEMVPKVLQGRYDAITACFMRGYELGLGPMQALDSFNVIEGKVGLSAEAMRALIMQAGHLFVITEGDGYAEVYARRKDWPEEFPSQKYRYDMDDAERAQLLRVPQSGRKGGWQKNPRAMLAARATSGAARAFFADVLAGMSYTPEEIRDFTDEGEAPTFPPTPVSSTPAVATSPTPVQEPPTSTSSVPTTADTSSSPPEPPKRPRGRPRKDGTPPRQSAPPELTSLDAAIDATASIPNAEPTVPPGPGEGAVLVQTRQALTAIIKGLPSAQQPACRTFISQHFPGLDYVDMNSEELQTCINIAAGWPDSAAQHPLPDEGDPGAYPYSGPDDF